MKIGCRETSDFFLSFSLCSFILLCYLCSMKMNFDRKKALVFLIVIGGLIYITKVGLGMTALNSFLATLGVLLILFVGDNFAQQIDNWLRRRKMNQENEE